MFSEKPRCTNQGQNTRNPSTFDMSRSVRPSLYGKVLKIDDPRHKDFNEYMEYYGLNQIFNDILTTLFHYRMKDPLSYIIKFLEHKNTPLSPNPQPHFIAAPTIEVAYQNQNVFAQCFRTKLIENYKVSNALGGSFRDIIETSQNMQDDPVGVFANDGLAYVNFPEFFTQVKRKLLVGYEQLSDQYYHLSPPQMPPKDIIIQSEYLRKFKVKLLRNLTTYRFNNSIHFIQERSKINEQIQQAINDQTWNVYKLEMYQSELEQTKLASNLNDDFFGLIKIERKHANRGRQWPSGRFIYAQWPRLLQVNFEDHLKISEVSDGSRNRNLNKVVAGLIEYSQKLEKKLDFSFDCHQGYLTTKPQYLGLALGMILHFEVAKDDSVKLTENIQKAKSIKQPWFLIKQTQRHRVIVKLRTCLGLQLHQLFEVLQQIIKSLFQNMNRNQEIQQNIKGIRFEYHESIDMDDYLKSEAKYISSYNRPSINPQLINTVNVVERTQSEFSDFQGQQIMKQSHAIGRDYYEENYQQIKLIYHSQYDKKEPHYYNIGDIYKQNVILYQNANNIQKVQFVARRNLGNLQFKFAMIQEDYDYVQNIFDEFIKSLPPEYLGIACDSTQNIYENLVIQQVALNNLKYDMEVANCAYNMNENKVLYPLGKAIYVSANKKFQINQIQDQQQ